MNKIVHCLYVRIYCISVQFNKMASSVNIADILENAQMGRESALLGNYDSSIVYYQGVLQQIQKHMIQVKDPIRRQKWQVVSISKIKDLNVAKLRFRFRLGFRLRFEKSRN